MLISIELRTSLLVTFLLEQLVLHHPVFQIYCLHPYRHPRYLQFYIQCHKLRMDEK